MSRILYLPYRVRRGTKSRELAQKATVPATEIFSWIPNLCHERGWETIQILRLHFGPPSYIIQGPHDGPVQIWVLTTSAGEVASCEAWEYANPPHCQIFSSSNNTTIHTFLRWLELLVFRPPLVGIPGGKAKVKSPLITTGKRT